MESDQRRNEEEKKDSRSPEMDDMMESTGMQRSSANDRDKRMQQRLLNLSN